MRKTYSLFIAIIVFLGIVQLSFAQTDSTKQFNYLFKKGKIGIYAGPYFRNTKIDGAWTDISGGGGGLYYNNRFFIAGSSFGQWTPGESKSLPGKQIRIAVNGATIGVNSDPRKLVHFNAELFVGSGNATLIDGITKNELESMKLTFVAPMADVEINVYEAFRFFLGCDYRFSFSKNSINGLNANKFNGFSVFWGIKTGLF